MRIVKIKNSIIVLILALFVSCKPQVDKKITPTTENDIKSSIQKYDYSKIDLKEGFSVELIDVLPVKKGDTVLFRKWEVSNYKPIFFVNKESKFKVQGSQFINYYKTGENKFSQYKLSLENTVTKKVFNFSTCVNYGDEEDIYSINKTSSYGELEKITNTYGRFKVGGGAGLGNFIYFKIKDSNIIITRLEIIPRTQAKQYYFILDTLITVNNKNNIIDIGKLNTITVDVKNIRDNDLFIN